MINHSSNRVVNGFRLSESVIKPAYYSERVLVRSDSPNKSTRTLTRNKNYFSLWAPFHWIRSVRDGVRGILGLDSGALLYSRPADENAQRLRKRSKNFHRIGMSSFNCKMVNTFVFVLLIKNVTRSADFSVWTATTTISDAKRAIDSLRSILWRQWTDSTSRNVRRRNRPKVWAPNSRSKLSAASPVQNAGWLVGAFRMHFIEESLDSLNRMPSVYLLEFGVP